MIPPQLGGTKSARAAFGLAFLLLAAAPLAASEDRVKAMGGLGLLSDDETAGLIPFLDGNPAGLGLLPSRDRLDLSGRWDASTDGTRPQSLSTLPVDTGKVIGYQGLMLFPSPQWAFQLAVDGTSLDSQPAFSSMDAYQRSGSFLLGRASYRWGALALGLETQRTQDSLSFSPGLFDGGVTLGGGQSAQTQWIAKAGLLVDLGEAGGPRWQVGGSFAAPLEPPRQDQTLTLRLPSQPAFTDRRLFTQDGGTVSGGIYYEEPRALQARLLVVVDGLRTRLAQTVSDPSPQFPNEALDPLADQRSVTLSGAAKARIHFNDLDLRLGGAVTAAWETQERFAPGGGPPSGTDRQTLLQADLEAGLEAPEDYLVGLRLGCSLDRGTIPSTGPTGQPGPVQDCFQAALGGEKWISPEWAARIGVLNSLGFDPGGGQSLTSAVVGGVGFRQQDLQLDGRLTLGETFPLDHSGPTSAQTGFALAGVLFL
ncbi:MAG TPA: hypothetical protein VFR02_00050 [bacterium]|nr:hypothetical protein [bacterium]